MAMVGMAVLSPFNPQDYVEEIHTFTSTELLRIYRVRFKDGSILEYDSMGEAQEIVYWWYGEATRTGENLPIKRVRGSFNEYDGARRISLNKNQPNPKWSLEWHQDMQTWSVTAEPERIRKFFETIDMAMEYINGVVETYERSKITIDPQSKIKDTTPPDYGDW